MKSRIFSITIGEFWATLANNKRTFERITANMPTCLTTFSLIFEFGAVQKCVLLFWGRVLRPEDACQKRFSWFRLESKGAKVCKSHKCKSCRSRQGLSNEIAIQTSMYYLLTIYLQYLASIQPRTGLSKFANNYCQLAKS